MTNIINISDLSKTYNNGHQALHAMDLQIRRGEILALLGPNGAGKTTLISIICGIVNATTGTVTVDGMDNVTDYRDTRSRIGLVPQELTLGAFDKVINTLRFSRGLFGKPDDPAFLDQLLKDLSLWEKRNSMILTLSGGMKRRVLIAKALAHQPEILFLDEPTAGVDVDLRKDMWTLVEKLRASGVTIILTTHYIEEAEAIADRVGVINRGRLLLVDDKDSIMKKLGKKQIIVDIEQPLEQIPEPLANWSLELHDDNRRLVYTYDPHGKSRITELLEHLRASGIVVDDVTTSQSSLEDIFVDLVKEPAMDSIREPAS
jgi:ABC-2 type transport system ATP-binding protein